MSSGYFRWLAAIALGTYIGLSVAQCGAGAEDAQEFILKITQEEPYGGSGAGGILFFHLQRVGHVDRATVSIDGDLPLAQALIRHNQKKVRLTLEAIEAPELQRIER